VFIEKMKWYDENMKKQYLFSIIFILLIMSCNTTGHNNVLNNPYKKIENYNGNVSLYIKDRIIGPNQFVINRINQMDVTDMYSGYELTDIEKNTFMEYYDLLPETYKNIMKEKIYAIYFINNFKGAGMVDCVFDGNNNAYMILFFNRELLNKTISEWIEYRDNSSFTNNENINIEASFNTDYLALLFGLLHETSHIYDFYHNITPYIDPFLMNIYKIDYSKHFIQNIWDDFKKPKNIYDFLSIYKISFYDLGNKIDKELSMELYENLINTPFSSLYGSASWAEDFAETYTYYYLNKYFGIRYELKIYKDSELNVIYCPNDNPLVVERYRFFEKIYK
jgi:hypothetical protein